MYCKFFFAFLELGCIYSLDLTDNGSNTGGFFLVKLRAGACRACQSETQSDGTKRLHVCPSLVRQTRP